MLRLELEPAFTRRVVADGLIEVLTLLDAGARGGLPGHWSVFGDRLRVLLVDAAESEPGVSVVLANGRPHEFFHRVEPAADGIYRSEQLFADVEHRAAFELVSSEVVDTATLQGVFDDRLAEVDFAKVDVELAELDVLLGSGQLLDAALAVELEVHFPKRPAEAGCFAEVDDLMRRRGFELYDLDLYRFARRDGVPIYDFRSVDGSPTTGPTVEGQVLTGDALYIRHPWPSEHGAALKLACIFEVHRLRDCALALLGDKEVPADLVALLEREDDSLRADDGRRYGPNYHVFEELWRQRPR